MTLALLLLSVLFAVIAYDGWRLSGPSKAVPYEVTARPLGLEVEGVPTVELERRKQWSLKFGLGNLEGAYLFWAIASLGAAAAAVWSAMQ